MANTAVSAKREYTRTITFKDKEHEKFYFKYLSKCRYQDVYHKALVYCLGIDKDTRNHANSIYDFETGDMKLECLWEGWQTSGSEKIVRMDFNLYCNGTPTVFEIEDTEEMRQECKYYTVDNLFCCSYAKYFWRQLKSDIRNIATKDKMGGWIC